MKGGRLSPVINAACSRPINNDTARVVIVASTSTAGLTPARDNSAAGTAFLITTVKMMLLNAMTVPTDRSIPPLRMTIVVPIAKIPSMVVSVNSSCRLVAEPKLCWGSSPSTTR